MGFALAIALVTAVGLIVVGLGPATLLSSGEDEPPSPSAPLTAGRQVVAVTVAALLGDDESLIVAFAPPSTAVLSGLPSRDWGTVVVDRPRPGTILTLEAWLRSGERLMLVAEAASDQHTRQLRLGVPDGTTVVLAA
jgi:hypothetical protein